MKVRFDCGSFSRTDGFQFKLRQFKRCSMSISRTERPSDNEIQLEPPPVPAHMLEGAEPSVPRPDAALALPKWRDLGTRSGKLQVAGGLLLAFAYAYASLHIAGATNDSFDVVPG